MARQNCSRKTLALLISLCLMLASCTPAAMPTQQIIMPPATASQTPAPTNLPIELPTQQAVPSPSPTQQAIKILPTTLEQPGVWDLRHPYSDPNAPVLFNSTAQGYRLDPGFSVISIELTYRWIGIGDSIHNYQRIELRDSRYWLGDKPISAEAVDKLVKAIDHLRREPQVLTATTGSDDYPFWAIELTSIEGDKVLLYSASNSYSYIPWNVIYNGEIYSQYDESIPAALDGLFEVHEGYTIVSTWEGRREGYLPAVTFEPDPAQLDRGFSGLMPIYNDFWYLADAQKGELRGYLSGEVITDRVGDIEINWLTGLQAIDIDEATGLTVSCVVELAPEDHPGFVYWGFSCPVGEPGAATSYRYPIRLKYTSTTGQPYTLTGELFGYWEASPTLPLVPYPQEIGDILKSSPVSDNLLRDHLVYVVDYFGSASAATGVITHAWDADLILLGQVQVGGKIVPYTAEMDKVYIEDGKVVHWDLDRAKLVGLLKEVLGQTVTRRFLEYDPQGVINLYYSEDGERPFIDADDLPACASLPPGEDLPVPGQPLRGFAFNQFASRSGFYDMQVVYNGGIWRIFQLDLRPASPGDAFWMSVLPDSLKPTGAPPFIHISSYLGSPDISLFWSDQASPAEVRYYESMFAGWDTTRYTEYDQGIRLNQRWFDLSPDGGLVLLNCQAP